MSEITTKALEKSINKIKKAGFSHIKIELEAQLNRDDNSTTYDTCEDCDGQGSIALFDRYGNEVSETSECNSCYGEGEIENDSTRFGDEDDCENFILEHVSQACKDALVYQRFYNDGSVDSEITFTMKVEDVKYAMEMITAFKSLADEIGNGLDVDGAGMHIAVLTSGRYPTHDSLPYDKIANFKREVTKLLPALFVSATSGNFSRGFSYRQPRIASDEKYSAIYTKGDTNIEYRLFETCYDRPEALLEYVGTIARTLEYYADPTKKVAMQGKTYNMYDNHEMSGLIDSPEQVSIIKKQFSLIKPMGYTIKQIMDDRGIDLLITNARQRQSGAVKSLKLAYIEHAKAHETRIKSPLSERQQDYMDSYRRDYPNNSESWYWEHVTGWNYEVETESVYIQNNIHSNNRNSITLAV